MAKQIFPFNKEELKQQFLSLLAKDSYLEANLTAEQVDLLISYLELLHKWNQAVNLSAIKDPQQMLIKHLLDSLAVAKSFTNYEHILDVGTGAGLPGIPLSIFFKDSEKNFYLLDSLGKRIQFLRQVVRQLKLTNVTIIQSRVEDFHDGEFDAITSRAFTSLDSMTLVCEHLLAPNGHYLLLKGRKAAEELTQLPQHFQLLGEEKIMVPGMEDHERYVFDIVRK